MRPSEKFEAKAAEVAKATLRKILNRQRRHRALLSAAIERVIGIGSKSRRNSLAVIFNHCGIDPFSFRRWRCAFSFLVASSPLPAKAVKEIADEPKENYKWQNP
jgi:hypothetical protein